MIVINAYTVALAGSILLMGRIADTFGRRRVLAAGIASLGIASVICGIAPTSELFVAGRGLQDVASAALLGSNLALIIECFHDRRRRLQAIGLWGAAGGSGGVFGALFGGVVVEYSHWRLALLINAPIAAYLLLIPMRGVGQDQPAKRGATDLAGGLLLAATMVALLVAVMAFTEDRPAPAGWWVPRLLPASVSSPGRSKPASPSLR